MADTVSEVCSWYSVNDPQGWLEGQRTAGEPDVDVWSVELFELPEFRIASAGNVLQALCEGAIPFASVPEDCDDAIRILLGLLDRKKAHLFQIDPEEVLIVDGSQQSLPAIFCSLSSGRLFEVEGFVPFASALLESWRRNPDRERAYTARSYLCDAVAKLLEQEAQ